MLREAHTISRSPIIYKFAEIGAIHLAVTV